MATAPTTPPSIAALSTPPNRATDSQTDFSNKADAFLSDLPDFGTQQNALAIWENTTAVQVYDNAVEANASADSANLAKTAALGAANYVGIWSSLSGAYSAGVSVFHNGVIWVLLVNTSNIAATTPSSANTDWEQVSYEITQSATDTTAGRLLKVGDGGLMDNDGFFPESGQNLDAAPSNMFLSSVLDYPPDWDTYFGEYPVGINFYRSDVVRSQLLVGWDRHTARPRIGLRGTSVSGTFGALQNLMTGRATSTPVSITVARRGEVTDIWLQGSSVTLTINAADFSDDDVIVINKTQLANTLTIVTDVDVINPDGFLVTTNTLSANYIGVIKMFKETDTLWRLTIS